LGREPELRARAAGDGQPKPVPVELKQSVSKRGQTVPFGPTATTPRNAA
jgi:hypothetical protein